MTTLNLQYPTPSSITGLTVTGGVNTAVLKWDTSPTLSDTYEIWSSNVNRISTSTLLGTSSTNSYTFTGVDATKPYFFWIRAVSAQGVNGAFSSHADSTPTDYLLGSNFNTLKLAVRTFQGGSTISVDNVKAKIYWETAGGVFANSGLIVFTSTVTQAVDGFDSWTNPDNARVDDTSYATISGATGISNHLLFTLSDFGVPSTATVTGIEVDIVAKSNDVTVGVFDTPEIYDGTTKVGFAGPGFPFSTTNNTDQTFTWGGNLDIWHIPTIGTGVTFTTVQVKSDDTYSYGGILSTVPTATLTQTLAAVSSYDTWYEMGYIEWVPDVNEMISFSLIGTALAAPTSGTACQVDCMSFLQDTTSSQGVYASIVFQTLYYQSTTTVYGTPGILVNVNRTFVSGFRGLTIPGHTYRLYVKLRKSGGGLTLTPQSLTLNVLSSTNPDFIGAGILG